MLKTLFVVPILLFFGISASLQKPSSGSTTGQATTPTPPDYSQYAGKVNPVTPTSASQARAEQIYGFDCAMCHGQNGDGKGSVAAEQNLTIRDFRDPDSLKQLTDGEIFYIIRYGKGQMPPEGPRAKTDEVWDLVIYLRKMENSQTGQAVTSAGTGSPKF